MCTAAFSVLRADLSIGPGLSVCLGGRAHHQRIAPSVYDHLPADLRVGERKAVDNVVAFLQHALARGSGGGTIGRIDEPRFLFRPVRDESERVVRTIIPHERLHRPVASLELIALCSDQIRDLHVMQVHGPVVARVRGIDGHIDDSRVVPAKVVGQVHGIGEPIRSVVHLPAQQLDRV